ncbi:MAG: methyltransferase domain-containing protein [Chloroflexi bacterium]|nr:methyltransferase domain-containing protein [Chloroflexota bacterium]
MFRFGENWASFSRQLDETRLEEAMASLTSLFGQGALKGKSFLDIGCGSGLFSIAASRLGAQPVVGIDVDRISVETSQQNASNWDGNKISFRHISVLDKEQVKLLGEFDVVYSWGVLHHTGDMKQALNNAALLVRPGGSLMIAIYNRHWSSPAWKFIKWLYNHAGRFGQRMIIWIFTPVIFLAKWFTTFKNPFKMRRGMDFMHNIIDWVGGYPYEYASVSEITVALKQLGFRVAQTHPANVPTGCNEFVCVKDK